MDTFVESAREVARALTQSDEKPDGRFHRPMKNHENVRLWPCDMRWIQDPSHDQMNNVEVSDAGKSSREKKTRVNALTDFSDDCTLVTCQLDHRTKSEDDLEEEEIIFVKPTRSSQNDVLSLAEASEINLTPSEDISANGDNDSTRSIESEKVIALNQSATCNPSGHERLSSTSLKDSRGPTTTAVNQVLLPQAYARFFASDIANNSNNAKETSKEPKSSREMYDRKRAEDATDLHRNSLAGEPALKMSSSSFPTTDEKQMQPNSEFMGSTKKDSTIHESLPSTSSRNNDDDELNAAGSTVGMPLMTDEEIARLLFEEEMAENMRRQKQLEEDERLAAQYAAEYQNGGRGEERHPTPQPSPDYFSELYTDSNASIDFESRSKDLQELHSRATAQTILEMERSYQELQRQKQEEADAELARLLMRDESGPQSYRQPFEFADAEYAMQLQKEAEMEEASMRLIRQLQESEGESPFPMEENAEDELLARDLQRQYENSASADLAYLINQPYGEELATLKDLHPESTVDECLSALAKAGYQVDEAHRLLSEFPSLGKPSGPKRSFGQVSEEYVERSPVYSIQVLVEDLKRLYGHRIPIVALRQAAEDANGILAEAENILYQKFPQEMIYMSMHAKSTVANQTSASQNEKVQAASAQKIRVTKVRGVDMDSLTREKAPSSPGNNNDESLDEIDPHYLDLARRDYYTAEDLIYGCQKYGDYYQVQPNRDSSRGSDTRNTVIYAALRKRQDQWASHLQQTKLLQGAANKAGRYAEAYEWKKKFEQTLEKSIAVNNETADCLFAMKNPRFVSRLFEFRQRYDQDTVGASSISSVANEVSVDLHMLHVKEAEDRVRAVLEIAVAKHWRRVKIITGKGLHSRTYGESSVRGAIERLLQTNALVQSLEDQPGYFIARLKTATTLG